MRLRQWLLVSAFQLHLQYVSAFLTSGSLSWSRGQQWFRSSNRRVDLAVAAEDEIYLVSWDGCIADTVEWRIRQGLQVATSVWSEVDEALDVNDQSWLENKLAALSHVLSQQDENISVTCEYALASRLLLEEQELDEGRSNGKGGKYASKLLRAFRSGSEDDSNSKQRQDKYSLASPVFSFLFYQA